jgi:uncharacterized protein (UPF0548 family)
MTGSKADRKRAIDDYKNRKPHRGIFAVRCAATPQVWVGASPDLDAARNSTYFMLRLGSHRDTLLQAAWREHGEATFRFEVLEELDEDESPMLVRDLLLKKKGEWAERERARTLLP